MLAFVDKIASKVAAKSGRRVDDETIVALASLTAGYCDSLGEDLVSFSVHAKRRKIRREDLVLCVRRHPELVTCVETAFSKPSS